MEFELLSQSKGNDGVCTVGATIGVLLVGEISRLFAVFGELHVAQMQYRRDHFEHFLLLLLIATVMATIIRVSSRAVGGLEGRAKDGMSVRMEDLLVQPNDPHGIERLLEYAAIIDILHRVALAFRQVGVLFRSLQLQLRSLSIPDTPGEHQGKAVYCCFFPPCTRWVVCTYQLSIGAREQLIKEVEIPFSHRRAHDA